MGIPTATAEAKQPDGTLVPLANATIPTWRENILIQQIITDLRPAQQSTILQISHCIWLILKQKLQWCAHCAKEKIITTIFPGKRMNIHHLFGGLYTCIVLWWECIQHCYCRTFCQFHFSVISHRWTSIDYYHDIFLDRWRCFHVPGSVKQSKMSKTICRQITRLDKARSSVSATNAINLARSACLAGTFYNFFTVHCM